MKLVELYIFQCFLFPLLQVVFQIALKVLEDNRSELLSSNDDGEAMTVLSDYLNGVFNGDDENSSFISYQSISPEHGKRVCMRNREFLIFSINEYSEKHFIYLSKNILC